MTTRQPFLNQNAIILSDEEIDELKVDREEELATGIVSIGRNCENLLLYGKRGVGKTFLVRLLARRLEEEFSDLFPVYVHVAGLPMYNPSDLVAAFSRAVLLQICVTFWKTLLKRNYVDLRDKVSESDANLSLENRAERTVQRIFSLLMTSQRVVTTEMGNSIGFSAALKGEKTDNYSIQKHTSEILPFEFAEFVDELTGTVLSQHGKKRIVALCDDANQLPIFAQEEILARYFELFRAKKVQFLFVAAWQEWERERTIPLCFETVTELKGFLDFAVFCEFMTKASQGLITFEEDALRHLHESSKGEAVPALHMGYACWSKLEHTGTSEVNLELARNCAKTYWMRYKYMEHKISEDAC